MTRLLTAEEVEAKSLANRAAHAPRRVVPGRAVGGNARAASLTPERRVEIARMGGSAKGSKYGNKKTIIDGITFDSMREARRYQDLCLMQTAGQITGLRRQVPYPVYIKGVKICDWFADFVYREQGAVVVEDSKGCKTPVYRIKKKMVEAEYLFVIRET